MTEVDQRVLRAVRRMANGSVQGRVESAMPVRPRPAAELYRGSITNQPIREVLTFSYQGNGPASPDFRWMPLECFIGGTLLSVHAGCISGGDIDIDVEVGRGSTEGAAMANTFLTFTFTTSDHLVYFPADFASPPIDLDPLDFVSVRFADNGGLSGTELLLAVHLVIGEGD